MPCGGRRGLPEAVSPPSFAWLSACSVWRSKINGERPLLWAIPRLAISVTELVPTANGRRKTERRRRLPSRKAFSELHPGRAMEEFVFPVPRDQIIAPQKTAEPFQHLPQYAISLVKPVVGIHP